VIFEPSAKNVGRLNEAFGGRDGVVIEQLAVAETPGAATLYSNAHGSALASLTKRRLDHFGLDFEATEAVQTIRFEDYWNDMLGSQPIDLCKMDIEGHELDALKGFGEAINHVSLIQFEFGGSNIDTRTFFQDFWYFFQDRNFGLFRISPIGLIKIEQYREADEVFGATNYFARRLT